MTINARKLSKLNMQTLIKILEHICHLARGIATKTFLKLKDIIIDIRSEKAKQVTRRVRIMARSVLT